MLVVLGIPSGGKDEALSRRRCFLQSSLQSWMIWAAPGGEYKEGMEDGGLEEKWSGGVG